MVFAHYRFWKQWIFRRFVCLKKGKRQKRRDEEIHKDRTTKNKRESYREQAIKNKKIWRTSTKWGLVGVLGACRGAF